MIQIIVLPVAVIPANSRWFKGNDTHRPWTYQQHADKYAPTSQWKTFGVGSERLCGADATKWGCPRKNLRICVAWIGPKLVELRGESETFP